MLSYIRNVHYCIMMYGQYNLYIVELTGLTSPRIMYHVC